MTQEEKQLLLKDLCARLPYGVMCYNGDTESNFMLCYVADIDSRYPMFDYGYGKLENIKPYLRPMSSMTEEEKKEYYSTMDKEAHRNYPNSCDFSETIYYSKTVKSFDWLNSHHFDYRGLISKGLALEAPEDMYKEE